VNDWMNQLHLLEMLMPPQERVFVFQLREDPEDDLTRSAYADWLLDQGRPLFAKEVRVGYTPFGKPKRRSEHDRNWYPTTGMIASGAYPLPWMGSGTVSSGSISFGTYTGTPVTIGSTSHSQGAPE
jgi:uncharacterized protein (TIGR02996 family)